MPRKKKLSATPITPLNFWSQVAELREQKSADAAEDLVLDTLLDWMGDGQFETVNRLVAAIDVRQTRPEYLAAVLSVTAVLKGKIPERERLVSRLAGSMSQKTDEEN